jgi:hypothetical protein
MYEAHSAHIGGQLIDLNKSATVCAECSLAIMLISKVEKKELIRSGWTKLMLLDVHAANPLAFPFQPLNKVAADEATCATNQCFLHIIPS